MIEWTGTAKIQIVTEEGSRVSYFLKASSRYSPKGTSSIERILKWIVRFVKVTMAKR